MSADPGPTGSTRTIVETALLAGTGTLADPVRTALTAEPITAADPAGTGADPAAPSPGPTGTPAGASSPGSAGAGRGPGPGARVWRAGWPKLTAVGLFVAVWQLVAWSGWRPAYVLPGPQPVAAQLAQLA